MNYDDEVPRIIKFQYRVLLIEKGCKQKFYEIWPIRNDHISTGGGDFEMINSVEEQIRRYSNVRYMR